MKWSEILPQKVLELNDKLNYTTNRLLTNRGSEPIDWSL